MFTADSVMLTAVKNSLFIVVFSLITQQTIGLLIAAVLSTKGTKCRNFFKNVYYLPCVISSAALALLFSFLFNPNIGINALLAKAGIKGPMWLMDASGFIPLGMWVIGGVAAWQYMGSSMMLYMAAIAGISDSYYEAAEIDGAGKLQQFRHITLPLIKPMAKISIYNMTKGGPSHKTEVLASHLYNQAFGNMRFGYASAISIVIMVLCVVVAGLVNILIPVEE